MLLSPDSNTLAEVRSDPKLILNELAVLDNPSTYRLYPGWVFQRSRQLLRISRELGKERLAARSAIRVGQASLDQGNYKAAYPILRDAAEVCRNKGERYSEALAHLYLGVVEDIQQSYESSERHLEHSVALAHKEGNRYLLAAAQLWLTSLNMKVYGPARALAICERAIAASSHDESRTLEFSLHMLSEIGRQIDRDDLMVYANSELGQLVQHESANKDISVWDLGLAAELAQQRGDLSSALSYYKQAEDGLSKNQIPVTLGEVVISQGTLLIELGEVELGFEKMGSGIRQIQKTQNTHAYLQATIRLARAYMRIEQYESSLAVLNIVRAELMKKRIMTLLPVVLDMQFHCFEHLKQYQKALQISKEIMEEKRRVYSIPTYHTEYVAPLIKDYRSNLQTLLQENIRLERKTVQFNKKVGATPGLTPSQRTYLNNVLKNTSQVDDQTVNSISVTQQEKREIEKRIEFLHQQYPALSKAELQVCSLILLAQTTLQIARTLSLSKRTIDAHRRSIRKKISVDASISLFTALEAITAPSS